VLSNIFSSKITGILLILFLGEDSYSFSSESSSLILFGLLGLSIELDLLIFCLIGVTCIELNCYFLIVIYLLSGTLYGFVFPMTIPFTIISSEFMFMLSSNVYESALA
jgi:hypothetical protein